MSRTEHARPPPLFTAVHALLPRVGQVLRQKLRIKGAVVPRWHTTDGLTVVTLEITIVGLKHTKQHEAAYKEAASVLAGQGCVLTIGAAGIAITGIQTQLGEGAR